MSTPRDMSIGAADDFSAAILREAMVEELRGLGVIRADRVAAAFGTVPRHLFAPGEPLERAYATRTILNAQRNAQGVAVSMISASNIQAMMLEQAQLEPGMRVLEIGSGGYNAALIAELVGESGQVTTVDIDGEIVDRTRRYLTSAGYDTVNVVLADGADGVPQFAPYDCVIATTSAWDIPPSWVEQLAQRGRIVVPLRMRGLTRSIVFERDSGRLASTGYELCSFVPMRGTDAPTEQLISLDGDDVCLRVDGSEAVDAEALRAALQQPRSEAWSGVTSSGTDRFDGLHLWLAVNLPRFGVLTATKSALGRGVMAHAWPLGMPTALNESGFAYLALRRLDPDGTTCEFGAYGHGPGSNELAERIIDDIRSWDGSSLDARIEAYPAGTPDDRLPEGGFVLDRKYTRIVITWPR